MNDSTQHGQEQVTAEMKCPEYLYRYIKPKPEWIEDILVHHKLFFPSATSLNDPFDCALGIDFRDDDEDALRDYYAWVYREHWKGKGSPDGMANAISERLLAGKHKEPQWIRQVPEGIKKMVLEEARTLRVCSLTEGPANPLMWSHYGAHKGVAFQFKYRTLVNEGTGDVRCLPVHYDEDFPTLRQYMDTIRSGDPHEHWKLFFGWKAREWCYEKEWRMFAEEPNAALDIPDGMVTGVIFGWKMDPALRWRVQRWIQDSGWTLSQWQAEPEEYSFRMKLLPEPAPAAPPAVQEPRWQSLRHVLEEFQSCLSDRVPRLEVVAANDRQWSEERYQTQRRTGIFGKQGVYLIYDDAATLQYVGLATYQFDKRIWLYDDVIPSRRWTDVIPLADEWVFLAPALEMFLIKRLQPPQNKTHRELAPA